VLAIALLGCGQGTRPPGPANDSVENQAILAKLDHYIGCLQDHSSSVFQIADAYTTRVAGTPPTAETRVVLLASREPRECVEAIATARALSPSIPELDAAGEAFGAALGSVFALTTEGAGYYARGSKTYDPAKGAALHPRLVAAFDAFDRAQGALFDQVYRLNRTVHLDQLDRREKKSGRKLVIVSESMLIDAEALVRFAAAPWDQLDKLDLQALVTEIGALEEAIGEMTAYAIEHEDETLAFDQYRLLMDRAKEYVIAARQLAERARANVAYSDAEKIMIRAGNEAGVIGTPGAMSKAYNRLVEIWF